MRHIFGNFSEMATGITHAVTFQIGNDPIAFFELLFIQSFHRACFDRVFHDRMVRHHEQAIFDHFNAGHEAGQERGDQ